MPLETTRKQIVMVGDPLCGRSHRPPRHRPRHQYHVGDAGFVAFLDKKTRRAEAPRRAGAARGRRHRHRRPAATGPGAGRASTVDVPTKWVFARAWKPTRRCRPRTVLRWRALGNAPGSAIAAVCLEPAFQLLGADAPQYPVEGARPRGPRRRARRRRYNTRLLGPDAIAGGAGRRPRDGVRGGMPIC